METIPKSVCEKKNKPVFLAKLGNVMSVQPKKFDPSTYTLENPIMYTDEQGKKQVKGCYLGSYIRWRQDENGQMQSNAKLVKWEDGSYTMFIGSDAFEVTQTENPHTYSYLRIKDMYVEQQEASNKLMFKPCSIKHQSHIRKLESTLNPAKTMQVIHSFANHELKKKHLEQQIEMKIRAKEKEDQKKASQELNEDFIEEGASISEEEDIENFTSSENSSMDEDENII
ncbi:unnamed protein product [Blepharisma stoltei]|uniref:PAF1-like protein n=1 Tax=Blepharisma stoltei TaxID=1481888 RepID=A0AAU9KID8_9CILI|nr:unnamed protein product [Blepharisma stoltei]